MTQNTAIVNQNAKDRLQNLVNALNNTVSTGAGKSEPLKVKGINVNTGKVQSIAMKNIHFRQPLVLNGQITNTPQEIGSYDNLHVDSTTGRAEMLVTDGKVKTKGITLETLVEFGISLYVKVGCKKIRVGPVKFRKRFKFRNFTDFTMDLETLNDVILKINRLDSNKGLFKLGSVKDVSFPAYMFGIGAENTKMPVAGFSTSDLIMGSLDVKGVDIPNLNTDSMTLESFFPENGINVNNAKVQMFAAQGITSDIVANNVPLRLEGTGSPTVVLDESIGPFGVTLTMLPMEVNLDIVEMTVDDAKINVDMENASVAKLFTPMAVEKLAATNADLSGLHVESITRTVV